MTFGPPQPMTVADLIEHVKNLTVRKVAIVIITIASLIILHSCLGQSEPKDDGLEKVRMFEEMGR